MSFCEGVSRCAASHGFRSAVSGSEGEIDWAVDPTGAPLGDALVTGCSSIYKSLECAILIAEALGHPAASWRLARAKLCDALRHRPARFDRTWESKSRYAMDWFYPILAGWVTGAAARDRLADRWMSLSSQALVPV